MTTSYTHLLYSYIRIYRITVVFISFHILYIMSEGIEKKCINMIEKKSINIVSLI